MSYPVRSSRARLKHAGGRPKSQESGVSRAGLRESIEPRRRDDAPPGLPGVLRRRCRPAAASLQPRIGLTLEDFIPYLRPFSVALGWILHARTSATAPQPFNGINYDPNDPKSGPRGRRLSVLLGLGPAARPAASAAFGWLKCACARRWPQRALYTKCISGRSAIAAAVQIQPQTPVLPI